MKTSRFFKNFVTLAAIATVISVTSAARAMADCNDCKKIRDSIHTLNVHKKHSEQIDQVSKSYELLESLAKTYGDDPKSKKLPKEAVRPALDLVATLLKIDDSEYAIEAAYPMIKANKAEFDKEIDVLPKDDRDEIHDDIKSYLNVLKNGND